MAYRLLAAWILAAALILSSPGQNHNEAKLTAHDKQLNRESFEQIWSTIRDQYWDPKFGGLNWAAVHDHLQPKIDQADTMETARAIMRDMMGRLGKSHFVLIPAQVYGDLKGENQSADGATGLNVRVLEGRAIVTSVDENSPAAEQGVHPGWEILAIAGEKLAPSLLKIEELYGRSTTRELYLARSVMAKLQGEQGTTVRLEFLDGNGARVEKQLARAKPPGNPTRFGYLPTTYVWIKTGHLRDEIGYAAFNYFLDPVRLMPAFEQMVKSCTQCGGIIIDLRGNPGGLGIMAMGLAGWFISQPDQRLGTMYTREAPLKFVVNPRAPTYRGPLAILVDGMSGSTSEVFAGGLKDLGRARIFGTRTAGAALPSVIDRLPNGDGFQHALADYISEGGRPLEGVGVIPEVEVKLTRGALLAGRDPVLQAAIEWIHARK